MVDEPKQVELAELQASIEKVLTGGDPLAFVNAFFRCPLEAPAFPRQYWERRICAVAEMMSSISKNLRKRKKD